MAASPDETHPGEPLVLAKFPRKDDLEVHLRRVVEEGETFLDLRLFVVSIKQYGRGIWLRHDRDTVHRLISALNESLDDLTERPASAE